MSARDEWVGTTVGGKYRIVRFIARGGMGAVYEAQHAFVRRRFAIKFLRHEFAERRDALRRFRQEAQATGALEHENIAAVLDFGIADQGTPYLVMEYLAGCNLGRLLATTGPLPFERAAELIRQAALGAQAAHAAGVIHRDLKPHNLFVSRRSDGTDLLKLLDFGVAKLLDDEATQTKTGGVLGTPAYMSSEQARGEPLDERADVYALGAILYELLSGRTPHPGRSANAILHHIATEAAVPLAGDRLPPVLVGLVHRTLSNLPRDRPASAAELARLLEPFAERRAWLEIAPDDGEALEAMPPVVEAALSGGAGGAPLPRRASGRTSARRALRLGLGSLALASLAAGAGAWLLGVSPPTSHPTTAPSSLADGSSGRRAAAPPVLAAPPVSHEDAAPPGSPLVTASSASASPADTAERWSARQIPAGAGAVPLASHRASASTSAQFDYTNPYQ